LSKNGNKCRTPNYHLIRSLSLAVLMRPQIIPSSL
jgi:hypothetical protein